MASSSHYEAWGDSQPTNKPPYFNGANYAYCKNRMKLFLQAFDLEAWTVIVSGYSPPSTDMETWNNEESKKFSINAKAMHLIFCALGPDEYGRVSSCSNANEIWDKLEVIHEGTNEVKETKIGLLNLDYENFKMKPNEDIKTMSDCFSVIVNGLKGYGEKTAIIEAKNLKTLKLDELIGSLLTHEMISKGKEEKKKEVEKKNIGIALKSTKMESDSSDDDEEKEMTMFAKRLMKSNNGRKFQRREDFMNKTHKEEEKDQLICYECNKPGHMKVECPNLKKSLERKKHKNFVATWSDEDTSGDEDYVANLCLMAIEDDSMVTSNSSISIDYTFDELQEAYDELVLTCMTYFQGSMMIINHQRKVDDLKASFNKVGAKIDNGETWTALIKLIASSMHIKEITFEDTEA
ncbi:hypothetical protein GQ457_15G020510 [Hibiscus cannabinus]